MDEDAHDVVWKSGNEGWLTDEDGFGLAFRRHGGLKP